MKTDEYFMKHALKEAQKAYDIGEVPIGCVIVKNDKVIARGYNKREKLNSSLAHAEIIAINKASKKLNSWRLEGCKMYITLEDSLSKKTSLFKNVFIVKSSYVGYMDNNKKIIERD